MTVTSAILFLLSIYLCMWIVKLLRKAIESYEEIIRRLDKLKQNQEKNQ